MGVDFHVFQSEWQGSGIQRYIDGLYRAVLKLPSKHDWIFFVDDAARVPVDWPGNPEWWSFNTSSRIARLGWAASKALKSAKIDCYHVQFVSPLFRTCQEVVTIHDVLFDTHPQFFPKSSQLTLVPAIRRSIKRASMIFTVSEYSKRQIMELYHVESERIRLTPNAIDSEMFNPGDRQISRTVVREKFFLKDFILSVGRIEPRKNHDALIRSYAYLKSKVKFLPKLVFVGGKDFGYKKLAELIWKNNLEKDVVFLHSVSDQMLPHLYRAALVMAYPSHAEGFGIPPLEAMACGCPVITSKTTALEEVVGESGWLIDPNQWPTVADALLESIQSESLRASFAAKGLHQASKFSWDTSARTLINAYDQIS